MQLDQISFDESDKNLFQIDDLRLKADAIKHSILPKLHVLTHHAILKIREIYDIDVLEDSHIPQSPNFRTKRDNELKVDYEWAFVGITGKRTKKGMKEKWHGFKKYDGKPVHIIPFQYYFMLSERGLGIYFVEYSLKRLSDDSHSKIMYFNLQFKELIHTLCYQTGIIPQLFYGEGCEPFSPFTECYQWMIENRTDIDFRVYRDIPFPIMPDNLSELVNLFAWFYPVYDSYIQIAKGEEVRFTQLIELLNQWYRKEIETEDEDIQSQDQQSENKASEEDIIKAKELAEQRIKVMPAIRWQVFQRDNWKCVSCGRSAANDVILHVDHIVPRSKGGKDELDNYQTLCHICNIGKSNKDDTNIRKFNKNSK
jgi:5-methylcytosine-specific restriction endonuclease McrA